MSIKIIKRCLDIKNLKFLKHLKIIKIEITNVRSQSHWNLGRTLKQICIFYEDKAITPLSHGIRYGEDFPVENIVVCIM
jgi:hypothetical protein